MKRKDKKAEQNAAKKRRKEQLRAKRRTPSLERSAPSRIEKPTILIVCEGENTEPSYFRQFKLSSATIVPIGEGYNTVSLVNRAVQLAEKQEYDQVWCVFDKDDFLPNNFNNAIVSAEARGFHVAYSNQAFEYWLILHFEDHQGGGLDRKYYDNKINAYLKEFGLRYLGKTEKIITEQIFEVLESVDGRTGQTRQELAILRAKRNYAFFDHRSPALEESSTTVFRIVEELLKYI